MTQLRIIKITALVFMMAVPCLAADYHFSSSGSDTLGDGSIGNPFQSIAKLNQIDLNPGDRALFEGGKLFSGNVFLNSSDAGTAASPVIITSYGSGRATIQASAGDAFFIWNAAGIEIRDLNVTSTGRETSDGAGIVFYTDFADGRKLEHLRIDQVDVSGFKKGGITVGAWHSSNPGYRDVRIENVLAYDNGVHGIATWSYWTGTTKYWGHENIYVGHCIARDNPGDPNHDSHSGNGIIISGVDGAVVEYCWADNNGSLNSWNRGGPIGIWCWEANNVVIQHSISSNNKSGGTKFDGGGFDIDGGSTNCVMQYNYSYNNEGAGLLFAQFGGATAFTDNVARYNISENDGRKNGYAGVHFWSSGSAGGIQRTDIVGNTFHLSPAASGLPEAVTFASGGSSIRNTRIVNNIFVTTGGVEMITAPTIPDSISFLGNLYWSSGGTFKILWGGTTYGSLSAWRTASGQEMDGGSPVGIQADPLLKNPGAGTALSDPSLLTTLIDYELHVGSPAVDAGVDLTAMGIDAGSQDYFGNSIPVSHFDIGAHERASVHPLYYSEWQYTINWPAAADESPTGDVDGDGLSNLAEYALGGNPLSGIQANAAESVLSSDGSDQWFGLKFRRSKVARDLNIVMNSSTNLQSWDPVNVDGFNTIETVLDADPNGDGSMELVEIKTKAPVDEDRFFLRLAINP